MKDKLVFVKTESETNSCSECVFCGECADACDIIGDVCECEAGYCWKLAEEPKEIPTEYEWVKERLIVLENTTCLESHIDTEILKHTAWLKDNKPVKFVICTKENTKVWDEIRSKESLILMKLEYFFTQPLQGNHDILVQTKHGTVPSRLENYEINIYGKDKE